ncbi:hypothetical protein QBC34DRAFT_208614 [Podospora aff. communis PSN243]|uniref:Uncharacterized protein n=1 Tax=Podospora aff. communis PSN243 TaxID=3040156 RepID=A0AAV9H0K5_9PEZI|nr:hypothetical protein QBC34DRAFT_208614 [Podospora aff. communis PSN243]
MPSRTNSTSVKPMGAVPVKRFELPALEFKFASLTDGTDIPPPLPSPIEEEPLPKTPNPETKDDAKPAHLIAANGSADPSSPGSKLSKTSTGAVKRSAEDYPASPTLSARPGSIRRLFSRNLLSSAYANGEEGADGGRPPSRSANSVADSRKAKRSSGWFSRLSRSDSKRSIAPAMSPTEEKKDTGPPPPMIPELREIKEKLAVEDVEFGSDLFKNIK